MHLHPINRHYSENMNSLTCTLLLRIIINTRINCFYIVHDMNKQYQNDMNKYSIHKDFYLNTTMEKFKMISTLQPDYLHKNSR